MLMISSYSTSINPCNLSNSSVIFQSCNAAQKDSVWLQHRIMIKFHRHKRKLLEVQPQTIHLSTVPMIVKNTSLPFPLGRLIKVKSEPSFPNSFSFTLEKKKLENSIRSLNCFRVYSRRGGE